MVRITPEISSNFLYCPALTSAEFASASLGANVNLLLHTSRPRVQLYCKTKNTPFARGIFCSTQR